MKKGPGLSGRILVILLVSVGLSTCSLSDQPVSAPPPDALSFDQLLEGLDGIAEAAAQGAGASSSLAFPNGSLISSSDFSTYVAAIKRDFAAYAYACISGRPYLVAARPLVWDADLEAPGMQAESGLMWVPVTWWGTPVSTPVISFQHGTQVYRGCAPSLFNANPLSVLASPDLTGALQNYVECIVGALMASAGYTVVMPDYAGFGASTAPHPYVHRSLGYSVIGAVTTARTAVGKAGVTLQSETYLTGYSEGGYATMAGARAMLEVTGTAPTKIVPCAGAYSLSNVMRLQMLSSAPIVAPHYLLYTAFGYKAAEPTMPDLVKVLADPWDEVAIELFDGSHTNAEVGATVSPAVPPVTMLAAGAAGELSVPTGTVYGLLQANDSWVGLGSSPAPEFVHCPVDDVVPFQNAVEAQKILGGSIHPVAPVPFVKQLLGSFHIAAFPTAMLEAFKIIRN